MVPAQQPILCIDNSASSSLAVYLLERNGYEVVTRSSIADAIDLTKELHFDLHLVIKLVGLEIDSGDKLSKFATRTLSFSIRLFSFASIHPSKSDTSLIRAAVLFGNLMAGTTIERGDT